MIGFLNVYKPEGTSSAKVVAVIKKRFNVSKVGHMGTLDPLACGILPIAINKATRMFDYFLEKTKKYTAHFTFGKTTATLDREGEFLSVNGLVPTLQQIKAVLPQFEGEIDQLPPEYSAKKINGTCAYKLARNNLEFELKPKKVLISKIVVTKQITNDTFEFEITCGGGTYIRSLARDIAKALGTCGYMSYLERTESGYFKKSFAIDFNDLTKLDNLDNILIPIEKVFCEINEINLNNSETKKLLDGIVVDVNAADGDYFIKNNNELICVGHIERGKLKIKTFLKE